VDQHVYPAIFQLYRGGQFYWRRKPSTCRKSLTNYIYIIHVLMIFVPSYTCTSVCLWILFLLIHFVCFSCHFLWKLQDCAPSLQRWRGKWRRILILVRKQYNWKSMENSWNHLHPLSKWSFFTCFDRVQQLSENNFQRKIAEIS
jgi:hypothetical protein